MNFKKIPEDFLGIPVKFTIIAVIGLFLLYLIVNVFAYETAEIATDRGIYEIKYNRLTSKVYMKHVKSNEWKETKFKNLKQAISVIEWRQKEEAREKMEQMIQDTREEIQHSREEQKRAEEIRKMIDGK